MFAGVEGPRREKGDHSETKTHVGGGVRGTEKSKSVNTNSRDNRETTEKIVTELAGGEEGKNRGVGIPGGKPEKETHAQDKDVNMTMQPGV